MTEAEITLAYERANIEAKSKQIEGNYITNSAAVPPPVALYKTPVSFWTKLSRFSSSFIILGVALFGAHYVYKVGAFHFIILTINFQVIYKF